MEILTPTSKVEWIAKTQRTPLLPYQRALVNSTSSYVIVEKARRIGLTWTHACWSNMRRLKLREDEWFASADATATAEYINYCKYWSEITNIVCKGEVIPLKEATTEVVKFRNGSRITALSSRPEALRSKGGSVCLDEYAWTEDQEGLFLAAQSCVVHGGSMWLISTHAGRATIFNQICEEVKSGQRKGWEHHLVTIMDAVEQGLALKIKGDHLKLLPDLDACNNAFVANLKKGCLSEFHWNQEYLCKFSDQMGMVNEAEYDKCVIEKIGEKIPENVAGDLFIGIDVARSDKGDLTSIVVLEEGIDDSAPEGQKEAYRTVAIRQMRGQPFGVQKEVMLKYLQHPKVRKAIIEKNGLAMQLGEELHDLMPGIVSQRDMTEKSKATILERLGRFISQNRLSMSDKPEIKKEFMSLSRIEGKTGKISYTHTDCPVATAWALSSAEDRSTLSWGTN